MSDMDVIALRTVISARIEQLQRSQAEAEQRAQLRYQAEVAPFATAIHELEKVLERMPAPTPGVT